MSFKDFQEGKTSRTREERKETSPRVDLFTGNELYIQQRKEWVEIFTDFETANQYRVMNPDKDEIGIIAERKGGLLTTLLRMFLRAHRSLTLDVYDSEGKHILEITRPFYFFWSELTVKKPKGPIIGMVRRRFSLLSKKFTLYKSSETEFAYIKSFIWKLWTFPLFDMQDRERGGISKKWGGLLKEVFTDSDTFQIQYDSKWTKDQKMVIFGAAMSIDLDYFEENNN